jgi:GntR family transcriptional regulator
VRAAARAWIGPSRRTCADPTPEEASTLDLGTGVPVLVYVRTAYTKDGPVRLTQAVFAGDRNRLVYELGHLEALYGRDVP